MTLSCSNNKKFLTPKSNAITTPANIDSIDILPASWIWVVELEGEPSWCVSTAPQQAKRWCGTSTSTTTDAKHSAVQAAVKNHNSNPDRISAISFLYHQRDKFVNSWCTLLADL